MVEYRLLCCSEVATTTPAIRKSQIRNTLSITLMKERLTGCVSNIDNTSRESRNFSLSIFAARMVKLAISKPSARGFEGSRRSSPEFQTIRIFALIHDKTF